VTDLHPYIRPYYPQHRPYFVEKKNIKFMKMKKEKPPIYMAQAIFPDLFKIMFLY